MKKNVLCLKLHLYSLKFLNMVMSNEKFQDDYEWRVLKPTECVENFSCGDEDLDHFITADATNFSKALLSVTYVVISRKDQQAKAYFSLATDKLSLSDFNSNSEFNRFRKHRFVHEKRLRSYPSVKLCRLGVDMNARSLGLGSMLISLVTYLCTRGNRFGCRFITVDAYQTAVPFYEKNGFLPLTNKDVGSYTRMMYMDLAKMI